jgi:VEFS-Box of polycomb protein
VQQYQLQPKAGELVERPQAPPQGSKLPPFRTLLREPLNRMSSIDDSTASDQQAADGVPVARRKASRMLPLPLRVKQPGVRYFHSRSCIPMTREEAQASMDSDDEPDTEAWQVGTLGSVCPAAWPPDTYTCKSLGSDGQFLLHALGWT